MVVTNASNQTEHLHFGKFIATDKPAWLMDWNNLMDKLDELLYGIMNDVSGAQSAIEALQILTQNMPSQIQALNETVFDQTNGLVKKVGDIQNDILSQNALIQNLDTRVTALEQENTDIDDDDDDEDEPS